MELLIGLDHKQWLPVHVEDSWDPDDDMRLMKSVFGHRYMITDGWGKDPRERDRVCKPEGETAPKAAEALRKGADAARGRGQRKSRLYQRTGARN